ncbi:hypothetical protein EGW08_009829, partial [Elysia chlorotica]
CESHLFLPVDQSVHGAQVEHEEGPHQLRGLLAQVRLPGVGERQVKVGVVLWAGQAVPDRHAIWRQTRPHPFPGGHGVGLLLQVRLGGLPAGEFSGQSGVGGQGIERSRLSPSPGHLGVKAQQAGDALPHPVQISKRHSNCEIS